jgi:hypothetical protein
MDPMIQPTMECQEAWLVMQIKRKGTIRSITSILLPNLSNKTPIHQTLKPIQKILTSLMNQDGQKVFSLSHLMLSLLLVSRSIAVSHLFQMVLMLQHMTHLPKKEIKRSLAVEVLPTLKTQDSHQVNFLHSALKLIAIMNSYQMVLTHQPSHPLWLKPKVLMFTRKDFMMTTGMCLRPLNIMITISGMTLCIQLSPIEIDTPELHQCQTDG